MKYILVTLEIKKMTISTNIAQHIHQAERELPNTYKEFADIFQQKDTDGLPLLCSFNHAISKIPSPLDEQNPTHSTQQNKKFAKHSSMNT